MLTQTEIVNRFTAWRQDWNRFCAEMLQIELDREQRAIIDSVQHNPLTSVTSGTARGKDFVTAAACLCFLYLTPEWDPVTGELTHNTKVAMTAPTDRQVGNIMFPEISRMFNRARYLPGRLVGYDVRTPDKEWFLTGFKADEHQHEAWSGFHAVNTMFAVTEASGITDSVFEAIEGNLQGNSRLLIVFNPNISVGYAAESQRSPRFKKFRLNSLNAPNVIHKKIIYPGQVDYQWVRDRVDAWCIKISESDKKASENDFEFEGEWYRPNDTFRKKVLGVFPKVSEGVLVPPEWIDIAMDRWKEMQFGNVMLTEGITGSPAYVAKKKAPLRLGVDVAGMGRDSTCFCPRFGDYVSEFRMLHAAGKAEHMQVVGIARNLLKELSDPFRGYHGQAFIDTIGEGAGVYSRFMELINSEEKEHSFLRDRVFSVKYSVKAEYNDKPLTDVTGEYKFVNMRAYLLWAIRDWLDPDKGSQAALPPDEQLREELTQILWQFTSNGAIKVESKDDIKKRIKRSPDKTDALAVTFHPAPDVDPNPVKKNSVNKLAKMLG